MPKFVKINARPQHTEEAFRKYEPYIRQLVKNYPNPTKWRTHISVQTFRGRCRDAMNAFLCSGWDSDIDKEHLAKVLDEFGFVIDMSSNEVWFGPKEVIQTGESPLAVIEELDKQTLPTIDVSIEQVLLAAMTLKDFGAVDAPITVTNFPEDRRVELEEAFPNVTAIAKDGVTTLF